MAQTTLNTQQFSGVQRADLDITTSTKSVIAKVIQGTGVSISSTGADSGTGDVTINLDINGLTTDNTPDVDADYIATYDASATTNKKVLLATLIRTASFGLYNHNTTQNASSTLTAINLNTNVIEVGSGVDHDTVSNNTRIYTMSPDGSHYFVHISCNWSGGSAVTISGDLYKSSTTVPGSSFTAIFPSAGSASTVQHSILMTSDQGEYIELRLASSTNTGTFANIYISVEQVYQ